MPKMSDGVELRKQAVSKATQIKTEATNTNGEEAAIVHEGVIS